MQTKSARPAGQRRAFACCGSKRMIPSLPPRSYMKKTRKRRSKSATGNNKYGSCPFLFGPALHYVPMKITRRISAFSPLFASLLFSVAGGLVDIPAANHKYLVFVGTYTSKTESK